MRLFRHLLTVGERFYHILGEETNEYDRYLPATDNQFGANNIDVVEIGEPGWVVGTQHDVSYAGVVGTAIELQPSQVGLSPSIDDYCEK